MIHWFHRLFNFHCPECEAKPRCLVCDELRSLLATEKHEKKILLDSLLQRTTIEVPGPNKEIENKKPIEIKPKAMTWRVRQELLEAEDRARKQVLEEQKRKNAELEKELGVS